MLRASAREELMAGARSDRASAAAAYDAAYTTKVNVAARAAELRRKAEDMVMQASQAEQEAEACEGTFTRKRKLLDAVDQGMRDAAVSYEQDEQEYEAFVDRAWKEYRGRGEGGSPKTELEVYDRLDAQWMRSMKEKRRPWKYCKSE